MNFNLMMPIRAMKHYDEWMGEAHLGDVARLAEDAGFAGVCVTEHPFPDDAWLSKGGHHAFDPFVALSFMAASTTRVRLLTCVLVSGYRNPYLTAKALASLDKLSGGRVVAGMAVGYLQSEFEVLGASWSDRGRRFDAAIDAMRAAWTGETVDIGEPFPARGHTQLPRPTSPGGPPIWVGGNSQAARRRAATRAQGWMPMGQPKSMSEITKSPPLESIEELATLVADVGRRRQDGAGGGGGGEPFDVCFTPFGERVEVTEWIERIRRDLPAYEDAGVTWLTIEPPARTFAAFGDVVARVGDSLIAR